MSGVEDDIVLTVGDPLPEIVAVARGAGPFEVAITWKDGARIVVDLAPDIFTFKAFASLRNDPELFGTVHVVNEGSAIAWGAGDGIDMPATAIERLAEEAWTTSDFQTFLRENNLTWDAAAAQLGISRRLVGYYTRGRSVPRYISLACAHIAHIKSII